jgi:hypothetical protein
MNEFLADYYGTNLQKIAAEPDKPGILSKAWEGIKAAPGKIDLGAKELGYRILMGPKNAPGGIERTIAGRGQRLAQWASKSPGRGKALGVAARALGYGIPLGAVGGVGYGTYKGVQKLKEKESSAFDQIIYTRAQEMLEEAGYIEKQASFEEQLDRAALELLEANGYPVQWY